MSFLTVSVLGGVVQDLCTFTNRIPSDGETVVASAFSMAPGGKGSNSAVAVYRLTRRNQKRVLTLTSISVASQHKHAYADNFVDDRHDGCEPSRQKHCRISHNDRGDVKVRMFGAVGNDQFGSALIKNLEHCGVDTGGVRLIEGGQTAVANIVVQEDTKMSRILQYPGVNATFAPSHFLTAESLGGGIRPDLVICTLELRRLVIEQAILTAGMEGIDVLLNPSPVYLLTPSFYQYITHLIMNETEAAELADAGPEDMKKDIWWRGVARYFLSLGVKNVVITLGSLGAYFANEHESGIVEAEKNCLIRDTSGAGYASFNNLSASNL
ncbi:MAG: hypothetical protein Q9162_001906 [Coniocarpon cinnabarinum]